MSYLVNMNFNILLRTAFNLLINSADCSLNIYNGLLSDAKDNCEFFNFSAKIVILSLTFIPPAFLYLKVLSRFDIIYIQGSYRSFQTIFNAFSRNLKNVSMRVLNIHTGLSRNSGNPLLWISFLLNLRLHNNN